MNLSDFIQAHAQRKFEWGTADCCLVLADYAVWLGHPDPAGHLRGAYSSEDGCRAVVGTAGGLAPLVAPCVAKVGGWDVSEPGERTIAVIGSPERINRQWGAIWDGERWLVRDRESFTAFRARPLAMWRI